MLAVNCKQIRIDYGIEIAIIEQHSNFIFVCQTSIKSSINQRVRTGKSGYK